MKIKIMSRASLEKLAMKPFDSQVAVISITDVDMPPVRLNSMPNAILRLSFEDVDNDLIIDELGCNPTKKQRKNIEHKYNMFSDDQSDQIAAFYQAVKENIDILICQCEHGQSRSAGVAAAILEFRSKRGVEVFANDKYYPNKVVYRRTLKSLQQNSLDVISNC